MRALIVHNPHSGFGSDAIFEFERSLLQDDDECVMRILDTNPATDEKHLADAESFDLVVISGGDGTVSHALETLRGCTVPICVFPSGTSNLLAASIGNSAEPAALAAACRKGSTFAIDLGAMSWVDDKGEAHSESFAVMAGGGFDAKIMNDARGAKHKLGEAAYFAAVMNNLRPGVAHFTITVDGQVYKHEGISCLVANSAMMQRDIEIAPGFAINDGLLDVIILETPDTTHLLKPLVAGLMDPSGKDLKRSHVTTYRGAHITVESDRPLHLELDGDVAEGVTSSWEAKVQKGCCQIIADNMSRYGTAD